MRKDDIATTSDEAWDVVLQHYRQRNDTEMDFHTLKTTLEGVLRYRSSAESVKGILVRGVHRSPASHLAKEPRSRRWSTRKDVVDGHD